MPKISIVTPAYNCEKYLEEAVNSVLAQSFEDWELLIIDDCSKDATWLRMQTLAKKDNRIRIFRIGTIPVRRQPEIMVSDRREVSGLRFWTVTICGDRRSWNGRCQF